MSTEQKYIRVLFYLTPWKLKRKYIINQIISIRTLSKYSHCEIQTPNCNGHFYLYGFNPDWDKSIVTPDKAVGTTYSSTMRGGEDGTRKQDASLTLKHPSRWHYVEIPVTDEQYEHLTWKMDWDVVNNKGYALWDLLNFLSPIHFPDNDRNICSEAVNNWLVIIGILMGMGIVSPGKLLKKLLNRGYEVKPLN